ncbi:MAG: DnaJ domain-containing protein, partial [Giesbergeria sp.]
MPMNALAKVLLDFGRTPGRYALRLREPRELHAQLDTVALWAQGRMPDTLEEQSQELRAAAVLFIQRACFAQENNHYQVLGLLPGPVEPDVLRARYRSLIRLTHPDMGVQGLPSGAAGMVNRAQEVLANPDLREKYDQQLEGSARPSWQGIAPAPAPLAEDMHLLQRRRLDHHHGGLGERWRALWARYPTQARLLLTATGIGVLVVVLLAWAANDAPGGALVVARAPTPADNGRGESAARASVPSTSEAPASATSAVSAKKLAPSVDVAVPNGEDQRANLALARDIQRVAAAPQLPKARDPTPTERLGAAPSAPSSNFLADTAPAERAQARTHAEPVSAPIAHETKSTRLTQSVATDSALDTTTRRTRNTATSDPATSIRSSWLAPSPAPQQAQEAANAVASGPAPAAAPQPEEAATPAANTSPQWAVDVPGAKQYLRDLMMLLERPQEASRTN